MKEGNDETVYPFIDIDIKKTHKIVLIAMYMVFIFLIFKDLFVEGSSQGLNCTTLFGVQ